MAFDISQAITCLRTILSQGTWQRSGVLSDGALKFDPQTGEACFLSERSLLDPPESELLEVLLATPGRVFRRANLETRLRGATAGDRSLESIVHAIRCKLGIQSIRTVENIGWMVTAPRIETALEVGFLSEHSVPEPGNIVLSQDARHAG